MVLRAPVQVWSRPGGSLGEHPIDGIYLGDVRHIRAIGLQVGDSSVETVSTGQVSVGTVIFQAVLRGLDDATPDPGVRLTRTRTLRRPG